MVKGLTLMIWSRQEICITLHAAMDVIGILVVVHTHASPLLQVMPHVSNSWFLGIDPNAEQSNPPRLFASHSVLQQVAPKSKASKFIATIRDPIAVLTSMMSYYRYEGRPIDFAEHERWGNIFSWLNSYAAVHR
jgi:hypothetical protein